MRSSVLLLTLLLAACSPCADLASKGEECGDDAGLSVATCETARRRASLPDSGLTLEQADCLLACGAEGSCDEYFDRMYVSCVCEERCGVTCL